jgi:hypothetical protein
MLTLPLITKIVMILLIIIINVLRLVNNVEAKLYMYRNLNMQICMKFYSSLQMTFLRIMKIKIFQ